MTTVGIIGAGNIGSALAEGLARQGYDATSVDQIAERAGMSKPNLLYYFASKDDVHARLLGDLAGQGINVRDISTTQSSLEEIFMNLVSETPRVSA